MCSKCSLVLVIKDFMKPKETQNTQKNMKYKLFMTPHPPLPLRPGFTETSPPHSPLDLFNYHLNGFLIVIFPPKKFLKMPILHFTHKNLALDQFLHGVKFC